MSTVDAGKVIDSMKHYQLQQAKTLRSDSVATVIGKFWFVIFAADLEILSKQNCSQYFGCLKAESFGCLEMVMFRAYSPDWNCLEL